VFMLARLLPTTSTAVEMAPSADRAVEKDVNIEFLLRNYSSTSELPPLLAWGSK
jgi:hypothetical protein